MINQYPLSSFCVRWLILTIICCNFAACTTLPNAEHIAAAASTGDAPQNVQTANGTLLSPTRSKSLLARRLGHSHQDLNALAHLEQAASASPIVDGNRLTLLFDGPATMNAMMAAISAAKDNINFETYIFDQDELGQKFADLLIAKQKSGVQVNLMYDSVGAISVPREFFERMRAAGISVVEFNPINPLRRLGSWSLNHRDHRKVLVVDGKIGFVGGVNISADYSSGSLFRSHGASSAGKTGWRDTHVQLEGGAVQYLQLAFLSDWASQNAGDIPDRNYFPQLKKEGDQLVKVVTSTPDSNHEIYREYMLAIHNAQHSIHITTPYFSPNAELVEALIAAKERGVDVKLLFPSVSDSALVFQASQSFYEELLAHGIEIYQLQVSVLHAKTAVIDGAWSTVGSANLDWRSFTLNNEANIIVFGDNFGAQMENAFQEDLSHSDQITLENWKHRPIWNHVKEWSARAFAPLL